MIAVLFALATIISFVMALSFADAIGVGPNYSRHQNLCGAFTFICLFLTLFFGVGAIVQVVKL